MFGIRFGPHVVDALANLFHHWDYRRFVSEINGQPNPVGYLCALIVACHNARVAQGKPGIIDGKAARHIAALGDHAAHGKNQWVRLAQTMTAAAQQFAAFAQIHGCDDMAVQLAWCNGINLPNIPLANLKVNDLWNATDLLVKVPNIGRQFGSEFPEGQRPGTLREAGCPRPPSWRKGISPESGRSIPQYSRWRASFCVGLHLFGSSDCLCAGSASATNFCSGG